MPTNDVSLTGGESVHDIHISLQLVAKPPAEQKYSTVTLHYDYRI